MAELSAQGPIALHGATTVVDTAAAQKLGSRATDIAGNVYLYVDFQESCVPGEWVVISSAYAASQLTSTSIGWVGIVIGTVSASDRFGWVQIYGVHSAAYVTSGSSAGQVSAYVTTDMGSVIQSVSATGLVGVFGVSMAAQAPDTCLSTGSTPAGTSLHGVSTVMLNYPYISGAVIQASS